MADKIYGTAPFDATDTAVDEGLRSFLMSVFTKVAGGLFLSAAIAWAVANVPALSNALYVFQHGALVGYTPLGMIILFAPLALLIGASFFMRQRTEAGSGFLYWTVVALIGASSSMLVFSYTGAALVSTFLITAIAFGALALWGYTTRRNLTGFGNFLIVALVGLILAMLLNLFMHNPMFNFLIDAAGVLIFSGLIASDTQRLKQIYYASEGEQTLSAASNFGALTLYLNFLNLFQFLLSFTGGRSRN